MSTVSLQEAFVSRQLPRRGGAPRVLLYSHDSWGLGHLRRTLSIASALTAAWENASVLVVTGSPCATHFALPERVGLVKLPSITKDSNGDYVSRDLSGSLQFVLGIRSEILLAAFRSFDPGLIVIDHQVLGLRGEALPLLRAARRKGIRTILGVRDVVDCPDAVRRQWSSPEHLWALREGYDRICVYGSEEVFDPRHEYALARELADRIEFTGYIARSAQACMVRRPGVGWPPRVLVTTGGGQDGAQRVRAYLDSLALEPAPWRSRVVTGPLMPAEEVDRIERRARLLPSVKVKRFAPDLTRLLQKSRAVVAMAGYNTCVEIMQSGCSPVYLPRLFPRQEQAIRARRLAQLGLARVLLEPEPRALRRLVEQALDGVPCPSRLPSLNGSRRMAEIVGSLIDLEPRRAVAACGSAS